ncbi:hypothetical protein MAQ5080_02870 [Marinomonas aquimarina]|uniref:Uncharacterized protein n=1 Tax=Marinomonas aquimarina TaxID=295068 RepID=A0A1A8TKP6_9GAMM|nr:hypothetical protein MAQ5080_02870 [Marinomonas aquimarina]
MVRHAVEHPVLSLREHGFQLAKVSARETALEAGRKTLGPLRHRTRRVKGRRRSRRPIMRELQDHRVPDDDVHQDHRSVGMQARLLPDHGRVPVVAGGNGGSFYPELSVAGANLVKEFLLRGW